MSLVYTQISSKASRIYSSQGIDVLTTVEAGVRKERDTFAIVQNACSDFSLPPEGNNLNTVLAAYDEPIIEILNATNRDIARKLVVTIGASDERVTIARDSNIEEDERRYRSAQLLFYDGKFSKQLMVPLDSQLYSQLNSFIRELSSMTPNDHKAETVEYIGSIVFANGTSGYFAHEILGHLLEADSFLDAQMAMKKNGISFGSQIAPESLTLIDTPSDSRYQTNLNRIDDEGIPMREICLVSKGKVVGCLCTEKIAMDIGRPDLSGCARRQSFRFPVLPRMRSTCILPNEHGLLGDELMGQDSSLILKNATNGTVNPFTGDFIINGYGWKSRSSHSKILSEVTVSGNLLSCLASSIQIGSDFHQNHIQCRKNGQFVPVVVGGPTMRLDDVHIKVRCE